MGFIVTLDDATTSYRFEIAVIANNANEAVEIARKMLDDTESRLAVFNVDMFGKGVVLARHDL